MKIEINITKWHFWALAGMIVLLFGVTLVIAKTTTPAYTSDQPFHETLYVDTIAGKSADKVIVDDKLVTTGAITLGNVERASWPIYDYCYYDCWVGQAIVGSCGDPGTGNEYICCYKYRLLDNARVGDKFPIGYTTSVTLNTGEGILVKC